ncbi:MAG TPA: hypothetical protein VI300_13535 [Solirubrobacter sp.]
MERAIAFRAATAEEIQRTGANASVDEAGAITVDGRLVAITDEYGTAAWIDGITKQTAERFAEIASDAWTEGMA